MTSTILICSYLYIAISTFYSLFMGICIFIVFTILSPQADTFTSSEDKFLKEAKGRTPRRAKKFHQDEEVQNVKRGLPCQFSGYESTCQCRGPRFSPWSRKIPHVAGQLSPCTTTEAHALCNRRTHGNEKPTHHNWRTAPLTTAREEPSQQRRLSTAQNKQRNEKVHIKR